jgi:hypothetical protein
MKTRGEIGVRISRERLEVLFGLYDWLIAAYESENEGEFLLFSHVVAMYRKVEQVLKKNFQTISLNFSEPEALAFCQVWSKWNLDHNLYGKVVAHDLVAKIDKLRGKTGIMNK